MIWRMLLRSGLLAGAMVLILILAACQGTSPGSAGPRPRSLDAAGDKAEKPNEADMSNRAPVDESGGEVEYRMCRVSIPRGAVEYPIFIEVSVPDEPHEDVLPQAVYQVNPDSLKLLKDGLITIGYYDEDIPAGKDEQDLVIVHSVNNVWVELYGSKVHVHNNTVEAPIRFLGLYAIRIASYDPRRMNTLPVASFEFSTEPYPDTEGKPFSEAQEEMGVPDETESTEDVKSSDLLYMVNINTATMEELMTVNGLDDVLSGRIIEHRNAHGDFASVDDLPDAITGIGNANIEEMRPYITVSDEPEPVIDNISYIPELIQELRVVSGPEDAPPLPEEVTGSAGNVAEGASPMPSAGDDERPTHLVTDNPEVTVYFNATASHDPDGKIVQYDWDFDADGIFDHTSHSSPYAEHTFHYNGDYSVVLKVTDNGRYAQAGYGTGLVKVRNAQAEPKPLSANISAFPPFGPAAMTVNFAAATTGGAPPYKYTWTFSDGSESNLANPYTTYPEPNSYTIRFTVTDVAGDSLSGSLFVQACDRDTPATPQPRMELDISPYSDRGIAPYTGKFQLKASRATEPVTYRVTFGDETPGVAETVTSETFLSHYYGMSGFYMVKVIATDADLRTASTFATVNVLAPDIERDFTLSSPGTGSDVFSFGHDMHIGIDYRQASPRTVHFNPAGLHSSASHLAFHWDFGDGTYSTEEEPEHTYAKDGVYEVRLSASDDLERWQHRIWLPVSAKEPAVAIQRPSYLEGPAPFPVDLDAVVTRGEQPFRYDWFIGTARRSDAQVGYVFQSPGDYEIRLDVYDKWDDVMHAPPITVLVRPGPVDYRTPLAVIEPLSGSTRATVLETNGANPLPMSSPHIEGAIHLVDLSSDGQRLAIAASDAMLLKRVSNAEPLVAFLPAYGEIVAIRALNVDAALCTVSSAGGMKTYLLRPSTAPVLIDGGMLLSASATGNAVALGADIEAGLDTARLFKLDALTGQIGIGKKLPAFAEAQLSADGRELFLIDAEQRLVKRTLASNEDEYLAKGDDAKHGLTLSADGNAVAFVSTIGNDSEIIYGRYTQDGDFRLASVTDMTGFQSEQLKLSDDGGTLYAYGSRKELYSLLDAASGKTVAEDEAPVAADESESDDDTAENDGKAVALLPQHEARPPAKRERFGVISLDLSGSPDKWKITTVDAKWVTEGSAVFDISGVSER